MLERQNLHSLQQKMGAAFTVGEAVRDEFKYLGLMTGEVEEGAYIQNQDDYIKGLD